MTIPHPYSKDSNLAYTIGIYPTIELLIHQPQLVKIVYFSSKSKATDGINKIKQLCAANDIPTEVNDKIIQKLTKKEDSFVVGVFEKYQNLLELTTNHLMLVNPSDMGNMGTIMRTALGFDVLDIAIISPAVDIFDPKVLRASMGSVFQLRCQIFANFEDYTRVYQRDYYPFLLTGQKKLEDIRFNSPCTLIFGTEGAGLPPMFEKIGTGVKISQTDKIDSLNLAISVGIVCHKLYIEND